LLVSALDGAVLFPEAFLSASNPAADNQMKSYLITTLALGLLVSSATAQDKPDLTTPKQKTSYALGVNIGSNLKAQDLDLDATALAAGVSDALNGKPAMSQEEVHATLTAFQQEVMTKMQAKEKVEGEQNLKAGEAFLAENAKKEGVKTTASGLQYKILKEGDGPTPKATDTVKVNYKGTLIDGTVFDSSYDRGEPATFPVNEVIPGWTEALQMMKVGSKWQLFVPAKLAYGEHSPSPKIGPNSTLIFDVELLGIEK
jgi:FKBP-type peptidyl-prolyl cis-trans isomerase FklB